MHTRPPTQCALGHPSILWTTLSKVRAHQTHTTASNTLEDEGSGQPRDVCLKELSDCQNSSIHRLKWINTDSSKMCAFEGGVLLLHSSIYNADTSANKTNLPPLSSISPVTSAEVSAWHPGQTSPAKRAFIASGKVSFPCDRSLFTQKPRYTLSKMPFLIIASMHALSPMETE